MSRVLWGDIVLCVCIIKTEQVPVMASSKGTRLDSAGGTAVVLFLEKETVSRAFRSPEEIHHQNWPICVTNTILMYKTHLIIHS